MKQIIFIILFCLTTINLQGQCEDISKEILSIVKNENYKDFDKLLMPIEQQRRIMHWEKSEESDKMLLTIKDSLKVGLINSAKKLRLDLLNKRFDLNKTDLKSCQLTENRLNIFISNNEKEFDFMVETLKTDKIYLVLPINQLAPKLPTFQPTEEELANSTIIISGEKFKPFEPSENDKKKGLKILEKCIDFDKIDVKNMLLTGGMRNKNGFSILTFLSVDEFNMNRYKVILEKETCEKE